MTLKRYYYKIYNGSSYWDQAYWDTSHWDHNPVQSWEGDIISEPNFRAVLNAGNGQCVVKLRRSFDNFGEAVDVDLNLQVDLSVMDNESPNGNLIFRGFISSYAPVIEGGLEYVEVTLTSYASELNFFMLKDTTGNTALTYSSVDPSTIFTDIVDLYTAQGGILTYNSNSIETTGTTVSYNFNLNTIKEALDQVIELCPQKWYYYVEPSGLIHLRGPSNVVDHNFVIGKNILSIKPVKDVLGVVNEVYFVGGTPAGGSQIFKRYTRSSSASSYGNKTYKLQDSRVTLSATADTFAGSFLDYYQSPLIQTEIRIADSNGQDQSKGYDIESVQVGQNIAIKNLKGSSKTLTTWDTATWDSSKWDYITSFISSDILQIMSIDYTPNDITIQAALALPYMQNRIEDINRNLENYTQANVPALSS